MHQLWVRAACIIFQWIKAIGWTSAARAAAVPPPWTARSTPAALRISISTVPSAITVFRHYRKRKRLSTQSQSECVQMSMWTVSFHMRMTCLYINTLSPEGLQHLTMLKKGQKTSAGTKKDDSKTDTFELQYKRNDHVE